MDLHRFGSTRRDEPVVGQGTWCLDDAADAIAALRQGLSLGMTHIDTAEMYGSGAAEGVVRKAIAGGFAVTRADNKGKRAERVALHPVVVEHLHLIGGFDVSLFPWDHDRRSLYTEFARIQEAAGIHPPCQEGHEHTRHCHVYGFHDLRRAFATMNADKLTPDALQAPMRHKSYKTTQGYINLARQMNPAVAVLFVPDVPRQHKG